MGYNCLMKTNATAAAAKLEAYIPRMLALGLLAIVLWLALRG